MPLTHPGLLQGTRLFQGISVLSSSMVRDTAPPHDYLDHIESFSFSFASLSSPIAPTVATGSLTDTSSTGVVTS